MKCISKLASVFIFLFIIEAIYFIYIFVSQQDTIRDNILNNNVGFKSSQNYIYIWFIVSIVIRFLCIYIIYNYSPNCNNSSNLIDIKNIIISTFVFILSNMLLYLWFKKISFWYYKPILFFIPDSYKNIADNSDDPFKTIQDLKKKDCGTNRNCNVNNTIIENNKVKCYLNPKTNTEDCSCKIGYENEKCSKLKYGYVCNNKNECTYVLPNNIYCGEHYCLNHRPSCGFLNNGNFTSRGNRGDLIKCNDIQIQTLEGITETDKNNMKKLGNNKLTGYSDGGWVRANDCSIFNSQTELRLCRNNNPK